MGEIFQYFAVKPYSANYPGPLHKSFQQEGDASETVEEAYSSGRHCPECGIYELCYFIIRICTELIYQTNINRDPEVLR